MEVVDLVAIARTVNIVEKAILEATALPMAKNAQSVARRTTSSQSVKVVVAVTNGTIADPGLRKAKARVKNSMKLMRQRIMVWMI